MVQREVRRAAVAGGLALLIIGTVACGTADRAAVAVPAERNAPASTPADGKSTGAPAASATVSGASDTRVPRKRVVLLGTSLTAGLGLDPDRAYPALLQRKIDSAGFPLTLVNAGLSGETSAGALRRADWVLDQPAAAVILEVGANDGLRGVDPDSTKANIVALIRTVARRQPSARILLMQMEAPTNLGRSYTTRFHAVYPEAARETNVTLLPFLLEGVAGDARLNQADGIHPNVEGSKRVAETVWRALAPILTGFQTSAATR
jgi:acyl-CoA thioesterase-1